MGTCLPVFQQKSLEVSRAGAENGLVELPSLALAGNLAVRENTTAQETEAC